MSTYGLQVLGSIATANAKPQNQHECDSSLATFVSCRSPRKIREAG